MYLPRTLLSHLYAHLVKNTHPLSPPVLILVSLDPDAICACRILTALLKRDYIPHKVQPVGGYSELTAAGKDLVLPLTRQHGGQGGIVVCLGVGGLVDLEEMLGLDGGEDAETQMSMYDHGVEVWVVDARRPWNLQNVFGTGAAAQIGQEQDAGLSAAAAKRRRGVDQGKVLQSYTPGRGGIVVFDDGDIEAELNPEKEAFCALQDMPEVDEEDEDDDLDADSDQEDSTEESQTRKRKTWSSDDDDAEQEAGSDDDEERPYQRRRTNSNSSIPSAIPASRQERLEMSNHPSSSQVSGPVPSSPPPAQPREATARSLRRKLLRMRKKHESTLQAYYSLGTSYSEPISSMLYSLASELGREDNDLLWLSLVGVSSTELYGHSQTTNSETRQSPWSSSRGDQIRDVLRDEVRRLNPVPASDIARERDLGETGGVIPTHARSPTDNSIRLSPEPRFLLIRHWSLYESMLHSPYLSTRLHIWSDSGRRRLHKLLAKMGVSLSEAEKGYTHMDMDLKRGLRQRLLKFAPMYGLDGLVPPEDSGSNRHEGWGFVRSWGWQACLSATDVAVITSAILEVGTEPFFETISAATPHTDFRTKVQPNYNARMRALPTPPNSLNGDASPTEQQQENAITDPDWTTNRFFAAYDALSPSSSALQLLLSHVPTAQHLHRAILRTGSALINKHQIRHLRAFRMGVVREGPDVPLFIHPGALVKLATWVNESISVLEAEKGVKRTADQGALVLAALDERRGVYVVVGLGGGDNSTRVRSRAEMKAKADKKAAKEAKKAEAKLARVMRKAEEKKLRREREEANGIFADSDDEDDDDDDDVSSDEEDSDSDDEDDDVREKRKQRGHGTNRFGAAFQEVVEETGARVRIDSFEHEVVEVRKEDLSGFLEGLSLKSVVG